MLEWHRRDFLKLGMAALIGSVLPVKAIAANLRTHSGDRELAFLNRNTWESLRVSYFKNNAFQPEALAKINYILRDHHMNAVADMDVRLLDLLYAINQRVSGTAVFHVLSGYRSPQTNKLLRAKNKRVASNSLHIKGQAIDIRIEGYDTKSLCQLCIQLQGGGVGYYPRRNFVHIDTGPVRVWRRS